jgi:polysaccharide chain length determinant protein (PEP-CTERM system associated)
MQEILEQILDYLKGIWIKRRYIIISTWLICPLGWYYVAAMPDVYKSHARVYVDTQSLLRPLLRGLTVETNPNTQIRLMLRTLLSRPNLEKIARMTDLDVQASNSSAYNGIINSLKSRIRVSSGGKENIYTISIMDRNPEMAKNIVQSVLTVFIENTLGETRSDSDSAQKFLDTQIKEYENRLTTSEARLTAYKQKYSEILPESGGYYKKLSNIREKLKAIKLEILENKTKLTSSQKQLDQNISSSSQGDNKIKTDSSVKTIFDSRITDLEVQLDRLKLRFTDKHPDVVLLSDRLDNLEKQRRSEIEKYLTSNGGGGTALSNSPVIQNIQIQVNKLKSLIASLTVRAKNYQDQITGLEARIHTIPEIEAELVALNRDYGMTKSKYNTLISRKDTAQMAQQANETTDKIQFRVIDAPRASSRPAGPKRFLFFGLVAFLGVAVGIGLSLLFSLLNPIATSSSQLSKATGVPVFGMVSANENLGLKKWHKKKTLIFIGSNLLLLGILMIFVSYFLFPDAIQEPLKRIF